MGQGPAALQAPQRGQIRDRLRLLDADSDQCLSRSEFPGRDAAFQRIDANNDGLLDRMELGRAARLRAGGQGAGPASAPGLRRNAPDPQGPPPPPEAPLPPAEEPRGELPFVPGAPPA